MIKGFNVDIYGCEVSFAWNTLTPKNDKTMYFLLSGIVCALLWIAIELNRMNDKNK